MMNQGCSSRHNVPEPKPSELDFMLKRQMLQCEHWVLCLQGFASERKLMPLALCQIVAHEVKLENIRSRNQARAF